MERDFSKIFFNNSKVSRVSLQIPSSWKMIPGNHRVSRSVGNRETRFFSSVSSLIRRDIKWRESWTSMAVRMSINQVLCFSSSPVFIRRRCPTATFNLFMIDLGWIPACVEKCDTLDVWSLLSVIYDFITPIIHSGWSPRASSTKIQFLVDVYKWRLQRQIKENNDIAIYQTGISKPNINIFFNSTVFIYRVVQNFSDPIYTYTRYEARFFVSDTPQIST